MDFQWGAEWTENPWIAMYKQQNIWLACWLPICVDHHKNCLQTGSSWFEKCSALKYKDTNSGLKNNNNPVNITIFHFIINKNNKILSNKQRKTWDITPGP